MKIRKPKKGDEDTHGDDGGRKGRLKLITDTPRPTNASPSASPKGIKTNREVDSPRPDSPSRMATLARRTTNAFKGLSPSPPPSPLPSEELKLPRHLLDRYDGYYLRLTAAERACEAFRKDIRRRQENKEWVDEFDVGGHRVAKVMLDCMKKELCKCFEALTNFEAKVRAYGEKSSPSKSDKKEVTKAREAAINALSKLTQMTVGSNLDTVEERIPDKFQIRAKL